MTSFKHTIRKVKFLSKNSILTKPKHFHEFFIQISLTIFLVKSKLSTAKKSKTATFSRVFHPKKSTIFFGKSKLNFWTKNEDFEQCVKITWFHLVNVGFKSYLFLRWKFRPLLIGLLNLSCTCRGMRSPERHVHPQKIREITNGVQLIRYHFVSSILAMEQWIITRIMRAPKHWQLPLLASARSL